MASSTPPASVSRSDPGMASADSAVPVPSVSHPLPHPSPLPHSPANLIMSRTVVTMPASSGSPSVPPASFTVYQTTSLDPSHPDYQSPAAAVLVAAAPPAPGALNPRSCVTCRRRKVRCDKRMPCGNCLRTKVACVFPAPGRAPRKPRPRDPNAPPPKSSSQREIELRQRLRKLEGIVEELSGQLELEPPTQGSDNSRNASLHRDRTSDTGSPIDKTPLSRASTMSPRASDGRLSFDHRMSGDGPRPSTGSDDQKHYGRLVMHEKGKTRYVSSGFWSNLNDELEEIRRGTEMLGVDDSEEEDDDSGPLSPETAGHPDHHAFVLGFASTDVDLQPFHPRPSLIPFIWKTYLENVEIWIKIIHVPTMQKTLDDLENNGRVLEAGHEALIFTIYYSAVTSLEDDEVEEKFGTPKDALIAQYRFAVEQALAKAHFLTTSDFVVLQAFVLFLIIVRRYDDTRFCWSLSCIAIRVAQGMGLHRDGSHFGLSPFETEMRRRLWWSICILDLRSAEGLGTDLTIREDAFDTMLPTNLNDGDISPDSREQPQARSGPSDCAAALTRWSMLKFSRRLQAYTSLAPGFGIQSSGDDITEADRERDIQEMADHLEHSFLRDCDPDSHPAYWVASIIARIIQCKLIMVVHQGSLNPENGTSAQAPQAIRDRIFQAAYQILVYSQIVFTDPRIRQWQWLFLTYTQWHAIAFTLMEAPHRPWSAVLELWWEALYATLSKSQAFHVLEPRAANLGSSIVNRSEHAAVWLPLQTLFARARRYRETELARFKANPDEARRMDVEDGENMRRVFIPLHGVQERLDGARARWRQLVGISETASTGPPQSQMMTTQSGIPPALPTTHVRKDVPTNHNTNEMGSGGHGKRYKMETSVEDMGAVLSQASYTPLDLCNIAWAGGQQQQQDSGMGLSAPVSNPHTTMPSPPAPMSQAMHRHVQHPLHQLSMTQPMASAFEQPPHAGAHPLMVGGDMSMGPKDSWIWAQQSPDVQLSMTDVGAMGQGDITMDLDGFDWYDWHRRMGGLQMESRK